MRTKIFSNKPIKACYGCHACQQICPHNAITMQANEEGFLYPHIDDSKCIDCALCENVCPTQDDNLKNIFNPTPKKVYAAWNNNLTERLLSTSGGIFYVLARHVINTQGIVYGVELNENLQAQHKRISTLEELKNIRGSKYVQSDIGNTFTQAKNDLQKGKKVLFSGTPCQIAGLKLFLRKEFDNLLTVDLVCHGVPSPMIFKEHIQYIEKKENDKIINFKFRAKKCSGWRSYVQYIFKHRKPKYSFLGKDYYCHAFHQGHLNRESCYQCSFSSPKRVGDITLSDFWNGENYSKELKRQRKYGFNLVMCNTETGQKLVDCIADKVERRLFPAENAIKGDIRLRNTEVRSDFRSETYKIYREKGYAYMVDKYGLKLTFAQKLIPSWIKNLIREIQNIG